MELSEEGEGRVGYHLHFLHLEQILFEELFSFCDTPASVRCTLLEKYCKAIYICDVKFRQIEGIGRKLCHRQS